MYCAGQLFLRCVLQEISKIHFLWKKALTCLVQDSSKLQCNVQDSSNMQFSVKDSSNLPCVVQHSSKLPCIVQNSSNLQLLCRTTLTCNYCAGQL